MLACCLPVLIALALAPLLCAKSCVPLPVSARANDSVLPKGLVLHLLRRARKCLTTVAAGPLARPVRLRLADRRTAARKEGKKGRRAELAQEPRGTHGTQAEPGCVRTSSLAPARLPRPAGAAAPRLAAPAAAPPRPYRCCFAAGGTRSILLPRRRIKRSARSVKSRHSFADSPQAARCSRNAQAHGAVATCLSPRTRHQAPRAQSRSLVACAEAEAMIFDPGETVRR